MAHYYGVVWSYSGDSLSHHGIKGQRWGVRRFQNEDGTLTDAGKKRYGADLDEIKANVDSAHEKEHAIRRKVERKEARKIIPRFGLQHDRKQLKKANQKSAELESAYNNLKRHEDAMKDVKDTFDNLDKVSSGEERNAAANRMMKYIRDDPYGTVGNEAASRLHTVLADKAYDAFGDYDFNKDEYANCKTPAIRKADKAYMESKQAVKKRENELDKLARDTNTNRLNFKKLEKLEKNDTKLKELLDSEKKSGDKFAEECLKAIGFPVTPENIETIWPFLYGS